jgi:hypothetical protein
LLGNLVVTLENKAVRAENGALNHMIGNISIDVHWQRPGGILVSMVSDASPMRRFHVKADEFRDPIQAS